MRTSFSPNEELQQLIFELKKVASIEKVGIWKRVAADLSKPTRQRRIVNISRIDRYCNDNDVIVVPGKVLSTGDVTHKLSIAAYRFSGMASEKIKKAQGKVLTIKELLKSNPKGKGVRIIG